MKNKFTQAEIEELVDSVKKNPENLSKVFRNLSAKWGTHTVKSIGQYYYRNIKNSHQCFLTVGEKRVFVNRKIVPENTIVEHQAITKGLWSRIKNFFKL